MPIPAPLLPWLKRLQALPPKQLSRGVWWLAVVGIAYLAASATRTLWPEKSFDVATKLAEATQQSKQVQTGSSQAVVVDDIIQKHLFGQAQTSAKSTGTVDAPKTDLDLKLRGVLAAKDEKMAGAFIETEGEQNIYHIGSLLPGVGQIRLQQIQPDRVILQRDGRLEALFLEDFEGIGETAPIWNKVNAPAANVIDKREDKQMTDLLTGYRKKILSNPTSIANMVRVESVDGGGYRVNPGNNKALFNLIGLKPDDIVTSINGTAFDSPEKVQSLLGELPQSEELRLVVTRQGKEVVLWYRLKQSE